MNTCEMNISNPITEFNEEFEEEKKKKNEKKMKKINEKIQKNEICMGIKTNGERCTRKHLLNINYCKSHLNNNDNSRVINTEPKKRGRKPKIIPNDKIKDDDYIPVCNYIYNGERVLIDFDNNIYTNNLDNPVYLGTKTINGLIKYN